MGVRSFITRVRHTLFGRPLTHEEARARHEAQVATARSSAPAEHGSRTSSVQSQTYWGS